MKAKLIPPITNIIQTTTAMSLLYECINCIVSGGMLAKDDEQLASMCVSKLRVFFEETDQNLKFVGLLAYNKIVLIHPLLVAQNADVIMDCMDDPDLSIRERAVELVVYLVNADTLFEVVKRLMLQLIPQSREQILPEPYRVEVVRRILDMCSNNTYANVTNFEWYVAVLVDLVKITEGIKDIGGEIGLELQNVAVRVRSVRDYAVAAAAKMLTERDIIVQAPGVLKYAAWVVGEYALYLEDPEAILEILISLSPQRLPNDAEAVYIQAIPKVYCFYAGDDRIPWVDSRAKRILQITERIVSFLEKFSTSMDIEVQERSVEFLELFRLIVLAIKERPEDDSDLTPPLLISRAMPGMFTEWELNPVSSKAQRRIPIPAGLDLEEEINDPVYYSESEDEEEALLRQQLLKQQEMLAAKNMNASGPTKISRKKSSARKGKGETISDASESEDEEVVKKRREERRQRQAEDPYYILESEKVVSKSRKSRKSKKESSSSSSSSSSEDEGGVGPMKNEKLDIDSIPIMKLEIASIAAPNDSKKKKKKSRAQPAHVEIMREETFGDVPDEEEDAIAERRAARAVAGGNAKQPILRVNAKGLEDLDLAEPDDDEAGRLEVEKFKAEIQEARQKAAEAAAADAQVEATHLVVKKKKKAKVVKKVKKSKKKEKAEAGPVEEEAAEKEEPVETTEEAKIEESKTVAVEESVEATENTKNAEVEATKNAEVEAEVKVEEQAQE